MRIKSNIVLSDGRWKVYKGGRGASKIISSDTWYEEREDFSRAAIWTERKTHKEERGVEFLQGDKIFQGWLLCGCLESLYDVLNNILCEISIAIVRTIAYNKDR